MDLGTGFFVFAQGIVFSKKLESFSLTSAFKTSLTLFVIGIGRTVSTKALNYGVSVLEYGVHWNFFYTLGALPILILPFTLFRKWLDYGVMAVIIAASNFNLISHFQFISPF
jgi:phosphatidylinositol glycan class W